MSKYCLFSSLEIYVLKFICDSKLVRAVLISEENLRQYVLVTSIKSSLKIFIQTSSTKKHPCQATESLNVCNFGFAFKDWLECLGNIRSSMNKVLRHTDCMIQYVTY